MGRGKQKAMQKRLGRSMKYATDDLDLEALQKELREERERKEGLKKGEDDFEQD
ncbi:MAG: DUF3073 family protein [Candidatus Paceibacterota bacterium]